MIERIWPYLAVLCIGSAWGLTIPLTKVIVSDGYLFFGLIFWQQVICASVLGIVLLIQRQRLIFLKFRWLLELGAPPSPRPEEPLASPRVHG